MWQTIEWSTEFWMENFLILFNTFYFQKVWCCFVRGPQTCKILWSEFIERHTLYCVRHMREPCSVDKHVEVGETRICLEEWVIRNIWSAFQARICVSTLKEPFQNQDLARHLEECLRIRLSCCASTNATTATSCLCRFKVAAASAALRSRCTKIHCHTDMAEPKVCWQIIAVSGRVKKKCL